MDEIKTMIQHALWQMYLDTGVEEYNKLYQLWYEKYEQIKIEGLDSVV